MFLKQICNKKLIYIQNIGIICRKHKYNIWGIIMNKIKKSVVILFIALMVPVMLIGCKPKVGPDKSASIIFNAIVKEDGSELPKIGIKQSQIANIKKSQKDEFDTLCKKGMKEQNIKISSKELADYYKVARKAMKKVNAKTEIVSQDGKTAKIKVKMTYINIAEYVEKATADMTAQATPLATSGQYTDEESLKNKLIELYFKDIDASLAKATPSTDTKEETFDFKIDDKNNWTPVDMKKYSTDIGKLIFSQQ